MSDELDPQLKELFAAEKDEAPPEETKRRLAGALATTLALPLPTAALTATKLAPVAKGMVTAAKAWTMAVTAFVAGGTAVMVWTSARTRAPADRAPAAPTMSIATAVAPPPTNRVPLVEGAEAGQDDDASVALAATKQDASANMRTSTPASAAVRDGISAERELLESARTAANAGDQGKALRILDRHAQQFPRGQLWEEREALAIDALVRTHEYAQARARADHLRERSPNSLFLPLVDADLGAIP